MGSYVVYFHIYLLCAEAAAALQRTDVRIHRQWLHSAIVLGTVRQTMAV